MVTYVHLDPWCGKTIMLHAALFGDRNNDDSAWPDGTVADNLYRCNRQRKHIDVGRQTWS
ncbi:hypothetical protein PGTUg99_029353 [Puccinia graminis f. sp. tritici]|uniref:Uncharacterized protein n=1 Tax=Puccinia graminis f. sp. tritici TaxID=56615 RepID=A0A5B0NI61_PUCGR|nr:hypothetical protein PGTUg99_029353 [Puccinia graminis f. sp. tritici]